MDKKLLLAMQYQCNFAGLAVPWNDIGTIMGEGITGGAVIQHLAKLRTRMVTQGLSVPPPLKRGGGGSRISTSSSSGSKAKAKTTPTKNENAQANVKSTKPSRAKPKKAGKKVAPDSDESEDEDDDAGDNDDSDGTYGQLAKRRKTDTKGPVRRGPMIEESEEELSKPRKRKHKSSKSSSRELSAYGTTDINGVSIEDYSDDEDDEDDEDDTDSGLVAAGAPWLALEDDYVSHRNTGMKTPYKKKSLIVSLPITTHKIGMEGAVKEQETGDMDESEDEVMDGAIENVVEGTDVLSNEEKGQEPSSAHARYDGNFENVTSGTGNNSTMYGNVYHGAPQVTPNAFETTLGDPSAFNAFDGMFDNDELRFNGQSAHGPELYNNGGFDTGAFANGEIFNGIMQRDAYTYQSSIGPSNDALGGLPSINGQNYPQSVPYPIQTSWDDTYNRTGESYDTSVNHTPAGTSAGANLADGGYFQFQYDLGFEKSNMDYAANDGSDGLYHAEDFDGDLVDNTMFDNNLYGN